MPFFSAAPTAAIPDFRQIAHYPTAPSTSSSTLGVTARPIHSRSSLRPVGQHAMARPQLPSRHSLIPAPPPSAASSLTTLNTASTVNSSPAEAPVSGPMTRQRTAALAGGSTHPLRGPVTTRTGRRYTQPTRLLRQTVVADTPPSIPEVISEGESTAQSGEESTSATIPPTNTTPAAAATRGRQKRTARRRTVMGVEKVRFG